MGPNETFALAPAHSRSVFNTCGRFVRVSGSEARSSRFPVPSCRVPPGSLGVAQDLQRSQIVQSSADYRLALRLLVAGFRFCRSGDRE